MQDQDLKQIIKAGYAAILNRNTKKSFLPKFLQCCNPQEMAVDVSRKIGYSEEELRNVPRDANLGIGCGNHTALASIKKGETILDLGSGAGFDCFLASKETGELGKLIGVDITPEMVEMAKKNAKKGDFINVEFISGEIENLPLESGIVDLSFPIV
jgi:arsenite methyltransferase